MQFSDKNDDKCIIKSIRGHWRLQNEVDVLRRYQHKTMFLRPMIDEILEPTGPPSIVLKYLDSELLTESNKQRLTRPEIKKVAKGILEALSVLHKDGMVHTGMMLMLMLFLLQMLIICTDVKLDNVFVNYGQEDQRFSEIQLGDCGGVVSEDSQFAKEGHAIGAAFTRSPEAMLQLHWKKATDVWSFGNAVRNLGFVLYLIQ